VASFGSSSEENALPYEEKYNFLPYDCDYRRLLGLCRMDVEILECPDCGRPVSNTPSNVSYGYSRSLICPFCIGKREDEFDNRGLAKPGNPLHHGIWDTQEPEFHFSGTDYFMVAHPKCRKSTRDDKKGPMFVNGIWVDAGGKVVLGLECIYCGARNALKPFVKDEQIPLLDASGSIWKRIESPILEAIEKVENRRVEFKSFLSYNPFRDENDSSQISEVVGGVCGFLNTDGGILVIGVTNDKEVVGIEKEYGTYGKDKRNIDGYQLRLNAILTDKINKNVMKYVDLIFERIGEHDVCGIVVEKADCPQYYGQDFFVREAGRTVNKNTSDAVEYCRLHWRN
jgi:hypothetical protein